MNEGPALRQIAERIALSAFWEGHMTTAARRCGWPRVLPAGSRTAAGTRRSWPKGSPRARLFALGLASSHGLAES
jgi:hypothetical protein